VDEPRALSGVMPYTVTQWLAPIRPSSFACILRHDLGAISTNVVLQIRLVGSYPGSVVLATRIRDESIGIYVADRQINRRRCCLDPCSALEGPL